MGLEERTIDSKRGKERVFATRGFAAFPSALLGRLFIDCCILKEVEVDFVKQKIKQKSCTSCISGQNAYSFPEIEKVPKFEFAKYWIKRKCKQEKVTT